MVMPVTIDKDRAKRCIGIGMTGAGAVLQFNHGVAEAASFGMPRRRISIRVAASTLRFVSRERPSNALIVLPVA